VAHSPQAATVYLGLGSNVDAENNLRSALEYLQSEFGEVERSPVYRSKAVGFSGDDFLNACCRIETSMSPGVLKDWIATLENTHGRDRGLPKFADRTLDIDILLYDDLCGNFDGLELPRDEILNYAHVLKPLSDIAGARTYPGRNQTIQACWEEFRGDRKLETVDLDQD